MCVSLFFSVEHPRSSCCGEVLHPPLGKNLWAFWALGHRPSRDELPSISPSLSPCARLGLRGCHCRVQSHMSQGNSIYGSITSRSLGGWTQVCTDNRVLGNSVSKSWGFLLPTPSSWYPFLPCETFSHLPLLRHSPLKKPRMDYLPGIL